MPTHLARRRQLQPFPGCRVEEVGASNAVDEAADLVGHDDTGAVVPLRSVGVRTLAVRAHTTATAVVSGVCGSGAAQLTWQPGGHPLVLWDFTIGLE